MPNKTKAARMPWKEAVERYGEPMLKLGHSHQRVSNWRRDGVPGQVLILLERTKHNRDLTIHPLGDAARTLLSVPPPVLSMVDQLQLVWEHSNQGQGIGWRALESVVLTLTKRRSQG